MFCVKCGIPLPDDANFCFKCGCDLRSLFQRTETETCAAKIDEASSSVSNHKCLSGMSSSLAKVGDYIKFGSYPQNNGDVKEPIEWLVLDVNGNNALLISRYGLDCLLYHHEDEDITWENCDLRRWLNSDFLKAAFTEEEQKRIMMSSVANDDNPEYDTPGGSDTRDHVFCLSLAEVERYFEVDSEGQCQSTKYVREQGVDSDRTGIEFLFKCQYTKYASEQGVTDFDGYCCWWLRSPGLGNERASGVLPVGRLDTFGFDVDRKKPAVRPALWVNLYQRAGTETCAAKIEEASSSVSNHKCLSGMSSSLVKVGGYVKFGNYPQNNEENIEPIEWLVLEVNGNKTLLISRYGLDCQPYNHHRYKNITWENCDLREWLNGVFMKQAFTEEEQKRISLSDITNNDNQEFGTSGGNDTLDWVFCLSIAEAERYFNNNIEEMRCQYTEYAREQGVDYHFDDYDHCWWWLRSPGHCQRYASFVNSDGVVFPKGDVVFSGDTAVRPALWVNL